jgi:hypothetical protein
VRGRRAPLAPAAHRSPAGPGGGGGPPITGSRHSATRPYCPHTPAWVSRYPTRTPSAVSGHVNTRNRRPSGRSRPLKGQQGASGLVPSLQGDPTPGPTQLLAYPLAGRTTHSRWLCPFRGPVGRNKRGRLAPYGGVERPGRVDALRAIDASACPRPWRTCGPRRLLRQSQPDLIATHGDGIGVPHYYRQSDQGSGSSWSDSCCSSSLTTSLSSSPSSS